MAACEWLPAESRRTQASGPEAGMSEYDTDILIWSERQAALLRRVAAGERVNDQVDWENVIEEVKSVGSEQWHAVVGLLAQALRHMLKAEAWPLYRDAPTWRADAIDCRQQASNRFPPSMAPRIAVEKLYRQARRSLPETMDGVPPLPVPEICPVTLDELLGEP
jgi:hypothetical protein